MKIFAFNDIHGNEKLWQEVTEKRITKEKPDIIVCAGDFTIFENRIKWWINEFENLNAKFLLIHGNHESAGNVRKLCEGTKNLVFLHEKTYVQDNCIFMGYGGGGFAVVDKEFSRASKKFVEKMNSFKKTVLIVHPPPYGTELDRIGDRHSGNKSYREFVDSAQPDLVLCGHFHENFRKDDKIGKTRIINAGPEGMTILL